MATLGSNRCSPTSGPVGLPEVREMKSMLVLLAIVLGGYWAFKKFGQ